MGFPPIIHCDLLMRRRAFISTTNVLKLHPSLELDIYNVYVRCKYLINNFTKFVNICNAIELHYYSTVMQLMNLPDTPIFFCRVSSFC